MDSLYSLTLLIAVIFGALGALLSVLTILGTRWQGKIVDWVRVIVLMSTMVSLLGAAGSAAVHFSLGHGPVSTEPMQLSQFLVQHKAYWLVLALSVVSLLGYVSLLDRREQSSRTIM